MTGNTIASLDTATSSDIASNSLVIMATRDKYLSAKYETTSIDVHSLFYWIAQMVSQNAQFGSMTSEVSSDYSEVSHNHDSLYNRLSIDFHWDPEDKIDYSDLFSRESVYVEYTFDGYPVTKPILPSSLSIGNVFKDGLLSTLYVPLSTSIDVLVVPWEVREPKFGQVKFVARNDILAIDPTLESFDGWLYPDGTTEYSLSDFRLSDIIAQQPYCIKWVNSEKFVVKDCSSFIKLDNQSTAFTYVPYANAIVDHTHLVDLDVDGTISAYADIPASKLAGNGGFLHSGNGKSSSIQYDPNNPKKKKSGYISAVLSNYSDWQEEWASRGNKINFEEVSLSAKCDVDISIRNVFTPTEIDIETWPSHIAIPVMVYVGAKKDI